MSVTIFGLCTTARYGFLNASLLTAALVACSYGAFIIIHRMIYGVFLDPAALFEYVLHVPGPLPIDPFSNVILLMAVLGLGGWLVFRSTNSAAAARRDLVTTALLFATTIYCLGRSHPNNICNLAPFLALVALRALDRPPGELKALQRAVEFGLAMSVALLALSSWQTLPFDPRAVFDIHAVVARFPLVQPDVERVRAGIPNPDELGIADFTMANARHPDETVVWTPMDPGSLWGFIPSARRQLYIRRAAMRLRRSGWAIFDEDHAFLYDDLTAAYEPSGETVVVEPPLTPHDKPLRFRIACFNPRPQGAAVHVGPACPTGNVMPATDRSGSH